MISNISGAIKGVRHADSNAVHTIAVETHYPRTDKTITYYITCFDKQYQLYKELLDSFNYQRGVHTVSIDVLVSNDKRTSNKAIYKEGHEKEGQPFEYNSVKYILLSCKKYEQ